MSQTPRTSLGSVFAEDRDGESSRRHLDGSIAEHSVASFELRRSLAEVKGQAQFLLYLADQIEESLEQLSGENDSCHGTFLCKVLGM